MMRGRGVVPCQTHNLETTVQFRPPQPNYGVKELARTYNFELPYTVSGFMLEMGIGQLKSEGIFEGLPKYLQDRVEQHAASGTELVITGRDCNAIDDATWKALADKLGLDYSQD